MNKTLKQLTAKDHDSVQLEYAAMTDLYRTTVEFQDACRSEFLSDNFKNWSSRMVHDMERRLELLRKEHGKLCDAKLVVEELKRQQLLMPF